MSVNQNWQHRWWWHVSQALFLGLILFTNSCETRGDIDDLTPPDSLDRVVEEASVQELLRLYGDSLQSEDIDRLQSLLVPAASTAPLSSSFAAGMEMLSPDAFRQEVSDAFTDVSFSQVSIIHDNTALDVEPPRVSLWEIRSVEDTSDTNEVEQQTRVSHMVFQLARRPDETEPDVMSFLVSAVSRQAPLVRVTLSRQLTPATPTLVEVHLEETFAIDELEIKALTSGAIPRHADCMTMPGAMVAIETIEPGTRLRGVFTSPGASGIHFLCVRVRSGTEELAFLNPYWLPASDLLVEAIEIGKSLRLSSVAVRQNGDIWFGGEGKKAESGSVGSFIILSEQGEVIVSSEDGVPPSLEKPFVKSRIEAIAFDDAERPHFLFSAEDREGNGVAHGILINRGEQELLSCRTVNVRDVTYPFVVLNLQGESGLSPSTDVIAAGSNDIWLFGSDGGVARVVDEVRTTHYSLEASRWRLPGPCS